MNTPCDVCGRKLATENHHRFSNTKPNRKKYKKLLEDRKNKLRVCYACHRSDKPKWADYNERQFEIVMGIRKEKYCTHTFGFAGCLFYTECEAESCRGFDFNLEKYKNDDRGGAE